MAVNHVTHDSFRFNGVDYWEAYGLRCISRDVLLPKKRERSKTIPRRDGAYNFGAKWYDKRIIRMQCDVFERRLTRQQYRDLAYELTQEGRLYLWDEPDKYYTGEMYTDPELVYVGMAGHKFEVTFTCLDPFAYGAQYSGPMPTMFDYKGTAHSPTRIEIRNTGTEPITGIRMIIRRRGDSVVRN